jgi:hypothetical protein
MALFKTRSAAVYGIDGHLIDVEVDLYAYGNPRDSVTVGMPDVAVRESRERIKSALLNSGFGYPNKVFTINLAPANVRKEGAGFDLPMAIGILGAMGAVHGLDHHIFLGELSLDGAVRAVRGALSVAVCARDTGIRNLVVPAENAQEAAVVEGVSVYGVRSLAEVVARRGQPRAAAYRHENRARRSAPPAREERRFQGERIVVSVASGRALALLRPHQPGGPAGDRRALGGSPAERRWRGQRASCDGPPHRRPDVGPSRSHLRGRQTEAGIHAARPRIVSHA